MATDLKNNIRPVASLTPANQSDPSVPVNGAGVDRTGHDAVVFLVHVGTIGGSATPTITLQLQESDDNTTFTAIAAGDLDGGVLPAIAAATDETLYEIGYLGRKRYVRVSVTAKSGTSPALPCAASVVLGRSRVRP